MKKLFSRLGFSQALLSLLAVTLLIGWSVDAKAQLPQVPDLSLTGSDRYSESWYPDGRIWLPASKPNHPREVLVPVFITNDWRTYDDRFIVKPIHSFTFEVQYDSSALRAIGYQTVGMDLDGDVVEGLAKGFNISWKDVKDSTYRSYLNPNQSILPQDANKGRKITITATSDEPLPNTLEGQRDFEVLLFIKFRVIPEQGSSGISVATNTPLIIKDSVIRFNDWNVITESATKNMVKFDEDATWPVLAYEGRAGMNNLDPPAGGEDPILPGSIYLRMMDNLPEFSFEMDRGIGLQPPLEQIQDDLWQMRDPMTVDSGVAATGLETASRTIRVANPVTTSRLVRVKFESDADWLRFTIRKGNRNETTNDTEHILDYIDNGILGGVDDPLGEFTTEDRQVTMEVICDPNYLNLDDPSDPEKAGIYTGYITLSSPFADVSPTRLKITFIYFRPPYEPDFEDGPHTGIRLTLRNSEGQVGDSAKLVFGTGHRAHLGIDTLYGEHAYEQGLDQNNFDARFFLFPPVHDADLVSQIPYGFGDFSPSDEFSLYRSRDIRSLQDTLQSELYYVRFNAAGAQNYPVVIEWDTQDFPEGSRLFLRDTLNGALFPAVDMRNATSLGGTRYSFSIQDPRVTSFLIEYTLPRVIEYVDEFGEPVINRGWNFLSLPVRPTNTEADIVYPNASTDPWIFGPIWYTEDILKPGIGFFTKYSSNIDTRFAGTFISEISTDLGDFIRVFPGDTPQRGGWNSVGALSYPVSTDNIYFTQYLGETPDVSYTRKFGVWEYKTQEGYNRVNEMRPGKGYWVKVNANGYYNLEADPLRLSGKSSASVSSHDEIIALNSATELKLSDNAQHKSSVYVTSDEKIKGEDFLMPPVPPMGIFDIRFKNGAYVSSDNGSIIQLQGVDYPVNIKFDYADANYTLTDALTGDVLGIINKGKSGSVIINNTSANAIKVEQGGIDFGFSTYPNPAVDNLNINYSVPSQRNVVIKLYDAMGNEILTALNKNVEAGNFSESVNISELTSGTYLIKMFAGDETKVAKFVVNK
ncbi:MAG: T9SS type A sorting domain-containing protein [Candidatus Kapaibacterium sp.]